MMLLTCSSAEMESFFNPYVDRIVELIQGQITQIERKNNRVKVSHKPCSAISGSLSEVTSISNLIKHYVFKKSPRIFLASFRLYSAGNLKALS